MVAEPCLLDAVLGLYGVDSSADWRSEPAPRPVCRTRISAASRDVVLENAAGWSSPFSVPEFFDARCRCTSDDLRRGEALRGRSRDWPRRRGKLWAASARPRRNSRPAAVGFGRASMRGEPRAHSAARERPTVVGRASRPSITAGKASPATYWHGESPRPLGRIRRFRAASFWVEIALSLQISSLGRERPCIWAETKPVRKPKSCQDSPADQRVRSRSNMGRLQQVTATKHLYGGVTPPAPG